MVERLAKRDCLLILNYHRIGNREAETFDELVYNATEEEFTRQVKYLNQEFGVVTLKDALAFVSGEKSFGQPGVLLTFDDGYIDNYRAAFPILKSFGLEGTFFLVSDYLTRPIVPWWDKIAYLVRNTGKTQLVLTYPRPIDLRLSDGRRAREIRTVLDLFKSPDTANPERFLSELESACGPLPNHSARLPPLLEYGRGIGNGKFRNGDRLPYEKPSHLIEAFQRRTVDRDFSFAIGVK